LLSAWAWAQVPAAKEKPWVLYFKKTARHSSERGPGRGEALVEAVEARVRKSWRGGEGPWQSGPPILLRRHRNLLIKKNIVFRHTGIFDKAEIKGKSWQRPDVKQGLWGYRVPHNPGRRF